jgi:uncharacterized protein
MASLAPLATTRASEPFVVMAKPVGPICNLQCGYCYYLDTTRFYDRPHQFRMSDERLETYIRQYIEASPGPVVHFVWHGGEPTLAGLDFYRRAVELQQRYLPAGAACWNNLQTNGTLLDEEWCSFLAEANFKVGLSIDGTRWLHDAYRKDHEGKGTYERVRAAARRLQAHGIQPDLLCTVTPEVANEPDSVYRALRDVGTGWVQFLPIVRRGSDGNVTADSVTPEAYGRFLCRVFDLWAHNDIGKLNVQLIAETTLVWAGGTASLCWMAPTCGRVLVVEHDGAVYSCDHFVTPEYRIGDLDTAHLGALADAPSQLHFGTDKRDQLPAQCRSCPYLAVCNGGCPKDRFALTEDGEPGLNYLCGGLRQFFAHADAPGHKVVQRVRAGVAPEAIMVELRADSMERWRGVGRNDPCPCDSGRKAKACCWWSRP